MAHGPRLCLHWRTGLQWLAPSVRFSLGFYAGRVFSIIAASIVLIILLAETTRLYVLLARSHANLQREQDNKLMNFEAFVAAISHEIKQPLGVIELNSSSAQLILDETPADVWRNTGDRGRNKGCGSMHQRNPGRFPFSVWRDRAEATASKYERSHSRRIEIVADGVERSPHPGANGANNGAAGYLRQWKSTTSTHLQFGPQRNRSNVGGDESRRNAGN